MNVLWVKWEEVVEEINDTSLREFYSLCKKFGKKKALNGEPCSTGEIDLAHPLATSGR